MEGTNGEQTMEKAVLSAKDAVFQASAPWAPQAAPLGSPLSSLIPFQMPDFMPHPPPWESRVNQGRPGLTLLQQDSGSAEEESPLQLCREQDRNTKCGMSFMDTSWSLPPTHGLPFTTHEERLGRDEAGPGALAKPCELTLSSQTYTSCRDTKYSC